MGRAYEHIGVNASHPFQRSSFVRSHPNETRRNYHTKSCPFILGLNSFEKKYICRTQTNLECGWVERYCTLLHSSNLKSTVFHWVILDNSAHFISHKWFGSSPDNQQESFKKWLIGYIIENQPKGLRIDYLCVDLNQDSFDDVKSAMISCRGCVFAMSPGLPDEYFKSAWCTFESMMGSFAENWLSQIIKI